MSIPERTTRDRRVLVIGAGGTIGMTGDKEVTPGLDAKAVLASIPALDGDGTVESRTLFTSPSAHLTLAQQLEICRAARDSARRGVGTVVTHGTDTLEETAMLCDLIHDAEAPIVFTG